MQQSPRQMWCSDIWAYVTEQQWLSGPCPHLERPQIRLPDLDLVRDLRTQSIEMQPAAAGWGRRDGIARPHVVNRSRWTEALINKKGAPGLRWLVVSLPYPSI